MKTQIAKLKVNGKEYKIKFIAPEDSRCANGLSEEAKSEICNELLMNNYKGELAGSPGEDDDFYGAWVVV